MGLYEAQHPFLYYALIAPIYRISGGRSNLPTAISTLRLVNLAFGTAALAVIMRWQFRNVTTALATVAGCWIVTQPLLLLNIVRVANDALAFLLGSIVIVIAMDLHRSGLKTRIRILSLFLPLAILAKATNAALIPAVGVAFVMAAAHGVRYRTAMLSGVIVLTMTALLLAPYIIFNVHTYGLVTPMQEAVANKAAGKSLRTILASFPVIRCPVWSASWWTMGWWLEFSMAATGIPGGI